jgi:hypothetical protein
VIDLAGDAFIYLYAHAPAPLGRDGGKIPRSAVFGMTYYT